MAVVGQKESGTESKKWPLVDEIRLNDDDNVIPSVPLTRRYEGRGIQDF